MTVDETGYLLKGGIAREVATMMSSLVRLSKAAAGTRRQGPRSGRCRKPRPLRIEVLEGRTLLSATLIDTLDFSPGRAGVIAANIDTGRVYVAAEDVPAIKVIDSATNAEIAPPIPTRGYHEGIAVNPVTNRIYVSQQFARSVRIIDGATNTVVMDLPVPGTYSSLGHLAINPATNRLYVLGHGDTNVAVFDAGTNAFLGDVPLPVAPNDTLDIGIDPTTDRIYITNRYSSQVTVLDGGDDSVIATVPLGPDSSGPYQISVNPVNHHAYVTNVVSNTVSVIDGAPGSPTVNTVLATIPVGGSPIGVSINAVSGRVYVANNGGNTVSIIDGVKNTVIDTVPVAAGPAWVAVTPDRSRIFVSGNRSVSVIEDDSTPPVTSISLDGPLGTNGWYVGPVTITLSPTDDLSGVATTQYSLDGREFQRYTGPFIVSGDGVHQVSYFSTDKAGNAEAVKSLKVEVDSVGPTISASADRTTLWPPDGKSVPVQVTGAISDPDSGVDLATATYTVIDSYGRVQTSDVIDLNPDGSFAFTIDLDASRLGQDRAGRLYQVVISAVDQAGNRITQTVDVTVPHDQRRRSSRHEGGWL